LIVFAIKPESFRAPVVWVGQLDNANIIQ